MSRKLRWYVMGWPCTFLTQLEAEAFAVKVGGTMYPWPVEVE